MPGASLYGVGSGIGVADGDGDGDSDGDGDGDGVADGLGEALALGGLVAEGVADPDGVGATVGTTVGTGCGTDVGNAGLSFGWKGISAGASVCSGETDGAGVALRRLEGLELGEALSFGVCAEAAAGTPPAPSTPSATVGVGEMIFAVGSCDAPNAVTAASRTTPAMPAPRRPTRASVIT